MINFSEKLENPERAVISLGSNIEDRRENLQKGLNLWRDSDGVDVIAISSISETKPVAEPGEVYDGNFLNLCFVCDVTLSPVDLLTRCYEIEEKCGRNREVDIKMGHRNRTLDCDIIFYGSHELVYKFPFLIIPHPRWHEREFVVKPLKELVDNLTDWQRGMVAMS